MYLIPKPREISEFSGEIILSYDFNICYEKQDINFSDRLLLFVNELGKYLGFIPEITAGKLRSGDILVIVDEKIDKEEYSIDTSGDYVVIKGNQKSVFWGMQTFLQIVKQKGAIIPKLFIKDKPYFPNRGYSLDVSRGRVPTLEWLKELVDKMSFYKLNQLQLYMEHTYLFRDISELWRDDTPLCAGDILELDSYCRKRNIELVPCMATFGHLEKLLSSKSFGHLSELSDSKDIPFSVVGRMEHHTINALDPEAISLIKSMIDEYMKLFSSDYFNICADETFDLGKDKNRAYAEKYGKDRLYVDYVREIATFLIEKGKTPMFWGDIIVQYPDMIKELPKEMICINWGYLKDQREDESKILYEAGVNMYCCPGSWGWNQFVNIYENAYGNISVMTGYGRKYKAQGIINTEWGDYLHLNQHRFSLPSLIYGASLSWEDKNRDVGELNREISIMEFTDSAGEVMDLLSEITDCTGFCWNAACRYKELMDENLHVFHDYHKRSILEFLEDMERVDEKNNRLSHVINRLYRVLGNVTEPKRELIYEYILALNGCLIFNEIGKWVALEFDKNYNPKDAKALANRLDEWFYSYKKSYRKTSREGELYRITEVINFYGDFLREKE